MPKQDVKFSVLLPTLNRLQYLKYAVETVLRQDYDNWELIISDNCSEENIAEYVESLHEPRIKYYRTEKFISVTDNWNNALDKSTGEYILMLGDDDCLLRGYFETVRELLERYELPDFIYTNALQYCYPGVMPTFPDGYLQPSGWAPFFQQVTDSYLLDRKAAFQLVKGSLNMKVRFGFNTQNTLISRKIIDSLRRKGKFYQSQFPDYYATNVLFLTAQRILICPKAVVATGISPKSYGFYYFNHRENEGVDYLKGENSSERLAEVVMPGEYMSTGFLLAMEKIKENYGAEFKLRVNYRRYRTMQIFNAYEKFYVLNLWSQEDFQRFKQFMKPWERWVYGFSILCIYTFKNKAARPARKLVDGIFQLLLGRTFDNYLAARLGREPYWDEKRTIGYRNILEVFEEVDPVLPIAE